MGAAFQNQQEVEADRIIKMLQLDPTMVELSRDVLYKTQSGKGMDVIADRARKQGIQSGLIGEDEWTEEEKQKIAEQQAAAAQQPPQEDPNMVLARAEEGKAIAEQQNAQTKQAEAQFNAQVKQAEVQLEQDKIALAREELQLEAAKFERAGQAKFNSEMINADQNQQKIDNQSQKDQFDAILKTQAAQQQSLNDSFSNIVTMLKAMGATAVISPQSAEVYSEQVEVINDKQEE